MHDDSELLPLMHTLQSAAQGLSRQSRLKVQAAICILRSDLNGAEQNLVASQIPDADWEAALRGEAEY